ncbi:MAG: DUF6265 family protein [bacterium]
MRKTSNSNFCEARRRKGLKKIFVIIAILGIVTPISVFAQARLSDLDWLIGAWQRETAKSFTYETWRQLSDRTFEGESFRVPKATSDTVFVESLLLVEMAGEIFYMPKVAENKYPVPFRLVSFADGKAVFEHPEHDFPQRIIYKRKTDDSMTAYAEGEINGQKKLLEFQFRKVKK